MKSTPKGSIVEWVRGKKVLCLPRSKEYITAARALAAPVSSKMTSFGTFKDLVGYIKCRNGGGGENGCYSKGDSGVGAWGDTTAQIRVPMCAVPPQAMIDRFGSSRAARGKIIIVTFELHDKTYVVECECRDKAPVGVCDLNPAALQKAGLPIDLELSAPGTWRWK